MPRSKTKSSGTAVKAGTVEAIVLSVIQLKNIFLRSLQKVFISSLENLIRHDEWNTRSIANYQTARIKAQIKEEGELPADLQMVAYRDADDPDKLHLVRGHRTHAALFEMFMEDPVYFKKIISPNLYVLVGDTITDSKVRDALIADHGNQLQLVKADGLEELRSYINSTGYGSTRTARSMMNLIETMYPNLKLSKKVSLELAEAKQDIDNAVSPVEKAVAERAKEDILVKSYKGRVDSIQRSAAMTDEVWQAFKRGELNEAGLTFDRSQIDKLFKVWTAEVQASGVRCSQSNPSDTFTEAVEAAKGVSEVKVKEALDRRAKAETRPTAKSKDAIRALIFNMPDMPLCNALRDTICNMNGIPLDPKDWNSVPESSLDTVIDALVAQDEG